MAFIIKHIYRNELNQIITDTLKQDDPKNVKRWVSDPDPENLSNFTTAIKTRLGAVSKFWASKVLDYFKSEAIKSALKDVNQARESTDTTKIVTDYLNGKKKPSAANAYTYRR